MYYTFTQRREYRFPAIHWSNQFQRWIPSRNEIASRDVIIVHQEIDPAQLPPPAYFPGQHVLFQDSYGQRHQGTIERVGNYGCAYYDPAEHDYWYHWTYLGSMSYTYSVRTAIPVTVTVSTTGCYQVFASAVLAVL